MLIGIYIYTKKAALRAGHRLAIFISKNTGAPRARYGLAIFISKIRGAPRWILAEKSFMK